MKTIWLRKASLIVSAAFFIFAPMASSIAAEDSTKSVQFVFVTGEVNVPQRYVYREGLTLLQAVELAKGFTSRASQVVKLVRQGADEQSFVLDRTGKKQNGNILLKPGDKLFAPKKG